MPEVMPEVMPDDMSEMPALHYANNSIHLSDISIIVRCLYGRTHM